MFDVCTLLICLYRVHLLLSNHTLSKKEFASRTCFLFFWVALLVFCVQLACGACIYRYNMHATATAMVHPHAECDNIPIQVRFWSPKSQNNLRRAEFWCDSRLLYFAVELCRKSPARSSQYKFVWGAAKTQKNRWRPPAG